MDKISKIVEKYLIGESSNISFEVNVNDIPDFEHDEKSMKKFWDSEGKKKWPKVFWIFKKDGTLTFTGQKKDLMNIADSLFDDEDIKWNK